MTRHALLVAALLVAAASLAAPPHPSLPSATVPNGLGVNIHFTDPRPGEMEMLAASGVRWVRMDFTWSATERQRGQYDFSAYDRLLAALEAHQLHALLILDYGNELYEPAGAVATEEGRAAFAKWAAAAATRFQGRGVLWEIWNEPNIPNFWKPQPDVDKYTALALATSRAIRDAAPGEAIIGPATSGVDLKFLEGCFRAGLLDYWDAVSVHPYRQTPPETALADYDNLRRLITQYAPEDKHIPILSGEWGYSSGWENFDDARQGRLLPRQWLVNFSAGIPLSIWYDWHDDGPDPHEPEHHFGTVAHEYREGQSPVYEPKPAYLAAKTLTATLGGFQFEKRLPLENADDFALVFRRGEEVRFAVWTASAEPHEVAVPTGEGRFTAIRHTGMQARSIIPAQGGHVQLTIRDAPVYLVPIPADAAD
ncbi:MAG: beta-1,4-xylanase [Planctomycetota bacterium]|nr:MAG: beta-1,4-xylanase [Planctomycetota bacterium]